MLQRMEFADRLAELLALLEVIDRAAEYLLAQAHHFGGDRTAADIEHAFQQRPALIDLASTPSELTSALLKMIRAALWESTIAVRSVAMPFALGSTRNSVSPLDSPAAPAVRAATIKRSATCPSTTKALSPESLKPLPERTACMFVMSGRCFAPSSMASPASSVPFAIVGKS